MNRCVELRLGVGRLECRGKRACVLCREVQLRDRVTVTVHTDRHYIKPWFRLRRPRRQRDGDAGWTRGDQVAGIIGHHLDGVGAFGQHDRTAYRNAFRGGIGGLLPSERDTVHAPFKATDATSLCDDFGFESHAIVLDHRALARRYNRELRRRTAVEDRAELSLFPRAAYLP